MRGKILNNKVLLIYFLSYFFTIHCLASNFKFYHLNTEHGLSQNTINFIHQDTKGYFWFGTDGGLNQWNGYEFTTFKYDASYNKSIGQGRVNCLYEEENGDLWIGTTQGGLSKFDRQFKTFTNYDKFENTNGQNSHQNYVRQVDKYDDKIIIGSFANGLFYLDSTTNSFVWIKLFNQRNEILHHIIINKILIDKDSTMWVGHNKGILRIPKQKINALKPELKGVEILKDENVFGIYRDSKDQVWLGTYTKGVFYINLKTNVLKSLDEFNNHKQYGYPIIRDFKEDKHQNLWIGTGGNGITIIDENKKIIKHHTSKINNNYSLGSNIIYRLYLDKQDNMWVGTFNGGVQYTNNHKQSFNHTRGYGEESELKNNAILCFCEIDNNTVFIGTDGGGICIYNRNTGKSKPLLPFNNHDPTRKSVAISIDKDDFGNVYIGTFLKGLYVYNLKTKKIKNYRAGSGKFDLKNNDVWDIQVSKNNVVWIGTFGSGIARYDQFTGKFHNYLKNSNSESSLSGVYTTSLMIDSEDKLWIGTENSGLNILIDEEKGIFKQFKKEDESNLSSNFINEIFEDKNKKIWITTHDGGVNIFDKKTQKFKTFTVEHGFPSNSTTSIIEDLHQNIWIGTNKGISHVKFNELYDLKIKNFTLENGLQGNDFTPNAAINTFNNYLFFGGNNGFNYFHPDSIVSYKNVGKIIISDFQALYHNNNTGKSESVINEINPKDSLIHLKYNLSLIRIDYAMLDYTIPELNTYEFKLEGFDKSWTIAGSNKSATYTNLDPGFYTFKIKGTNGLGKSNKKIESISFVIHPPYWQTLWFRLTFAAVIIILFYLVYQFRLNAYKTQEKILKDKVAIRTDELVNVNTVLEERNKEIKQQSEELEAKSENLIEVNLTLAKSHQQIEEQNLELENHRNNLEKLVKERTEELEKAKLKAEESERLKMAFLANMSHEIRTPMNAIVGFSSLLTEDDTSQEERVDYSKHISSNSKSLLLLIDDILDLSKIEANQLSILKREFNFIDLFNETVSNWEVIINNNENEAKFKIDNKINEKKILIENDLIRIKQIINNLIDNAVKFTCVGSITLSTWIKDKHIFICVEDTGVGVSQEDLPKIFDRFRKSIEPLEKEFRGAGLGLTISKKLADLLGCKLWAESELGKGSKFYFKIPL